VGLNMEIKIGNDNNEKYNQQCFYCGATDGISLNAFRRLDKDKISGWFCICNKCDATPIFDEFILKSQLGAIELEQQEKK